MATQRHLCQISISSVLMYCLNFEYFLLSSNKTDGTGEKREISGSVILHKDDSWPHMNVTQCVSCLNFAHEAFFVESLIFAISNNGCNIAGNFLVTNGPLIMCKQH